MKSWTVAAILSFGFVGASLANPLDSPGTVYIDGRPCNLPCQSYMKWSRQTLNVHAERAVNTSSAKASMEVPHKRISRNAETSSANAPQRKKTRDLHAALAATPEPRPRPPIPERAPFNERTSDLPAPLTSAAEPRPVPQSATGNAPLAAETSSPSREKSPQEMVMAALAVAGQITSAETPKAAPGDDPADGAKVADADIPAPLVALVLSRPDVKSPSALNGTNVAIDAAQSAIEEEMIRLALALVGVTEVQLSVSNAPLDRLVGGDAKAAVVKLVSPDAADAFPEIKGFKVFRVPIFHISQSEYEAIHAPPPKNGTAGRE
jgi:hypothetical protein